VSTTLQDTIEGMTPETGFSLGDYAPRPERTDFEGGKWYRGVIVSEFTQPFPAQTTEVPVKDTTKTTRNVFLAATIRNKEGRTRNLRGLLNYNPLDLTPTRKTQVDAAVEVAKTAYTAAKTAYSEANGGSPKGFPRKFNEFVPKDIASTQFTYRKIGSLASLTANFSPTPNGSGGVDVTPLIGVEADFLLEENDRGYLDISQVAPPMTHRDTKNVK